MNRNLKNIFKISILVFLFPFGVRSTAAYFFSSLSQARDKPIAVAVDQKVIFAGGIMGTGDNPYTNRVDIFDINTGARITASLSQARSYLVATAVGDTAVLAGGYYAGYCEPWTWFNQTCISNTVDIYDAVANQWSVAVMPHKGISPQTDGGVLAATATATKAYFINGTYLDALDINSLTWSTVTLPRSHRAAAAVGTKIYAAGGTSGVIDVYDENGGLLGTITQPVDRNYLKAQATGTKIIFTDFINVDVYDTVSENWYLVPETLVGYSRNSTLTAAGQDVYFAGGNYDAYRYPAYSSIVDIYDIETDTWSSQELDYVGQGMTATATGNKVYFGGGYGVIAYRQYGYISWISTFDIETNAPPTADAGLDQTVDEGQSVTFDASASSDPDGAADIVSYQWDFGDGTNLSGQVVNHSYTDNGIYTATLTVTDTQGESDSDVVIVTVNNVAPTATVSASPTTIIRGKSLTLSFSNQLDPSSVDTAFGFTYSYDCTNDGLFELMDSSAPSYSCLYPTAGLYSTRTKISDKDGGYTDYLTAITVKTPAQAISDLIDLVKTYNLQQGIANSLDAKLEAAERALDDVNQNNDQAAVNALQAFIQEVEAQRDNMITNQQADTLVAMALEIIDSLTP